MKAFERPNIRIVEEKSLDGGNALYGKYNIQPLIRGFGATLGNSLRRILISSITGSGIVYIKIDGVLHEFSSIDGVVEDVTDILINFKGLRVGVESDELVELVIEKKGPCEIKAGDIQTDDRVTIVEKDYHLCTVTTNKTIKMKIGVMRGRGYVPTEWHLENPEIPKERGVLHIDTVFSPVIKTKFSVEPARVGQRTDHDKLVIEIETDGTVSPAEALSEAARILIKQFSFIVDFKERILLEEEKKEQEIIRKSQDLKRTIDEMDLSVRSYNCLKNANILTVEELITWSETRLRGLRNFGEKSLKEIKAKLIQMGLDLAPDELI
jgi:DNA-directed RNA polymerase subunit alpha